MLNLHDWWKPTWISLTFFFLRGRRKLHLGGNDSKRQKWVREREREICIGWKCKYFNYRKNSLGLFPHLSNAELEKNLHKIASTLFITPLKNSDIKSWKNLTCSCSVRGNMSQLNSIKNCKKLWHVCFMMGLKYSSVSCSTLLYTVEL